MPSGLSKKAPSGARNRLNVTVKIRRILRFLSTSPFWNNSYRTYNNQDQYVQWSKVFSRFLDQSKIKENLVVQLLYKCSFLLVGLSVMINRFIKNADTSDFFTFSYLYSSFSPFPLFILPFPITYSSSFFLFVFSLYLFMRVKNAKSFITIGHNRPRCILLSSLNFLVIVPFVATQGSILRIFYSSFSPFSSTCGGL